MNTPARCGIVLHPAGHTLSPLIHAVAYRELGLDAAFSVHDVLPAEFATSVRALFASGTTQLCVSLPHKEAALALADRVSDEARTIGAANTLTLRSGELLADNTDWIGVTRTLEPHGPWPGRSATVLGAGGAARAVVYALGRLGMDVTVVNRTPARAATIVSQLGGRVGTLDTPWDLLVNATSVGMSPDSASTPAPEGALRSGALVFDTVYRPLETRLLRDARAHGCRTQDGLDMLVHQAVEQIRLWSGRLADAAGMRRAALKELEAR
jgi:shikimate dehydrogenase